MKSWALRWLFPMGLLGTIAVISVSNLVGTLLAIVWGLLVFPYAAAYIGNHWLTHRSAGQGDGPRDAAPDRWHLRVL